MFSSVFFFNDTATTEIYTLSYTTLFRSFGTMGNVDGIRDLRKKSVIPARARIQDRKSTRLNSSHTVISYAVFCLKKKNHAATDVPDYGRRTRCHQEDRRERRTK